MLLDFGSAGAGLSGKPEGAGSDCVMVTSGELSLRCGVSVDKQCPPDGLEYARGRNAARSWDQELRRFAKRRLSFGLELVTLQSQRTDGDAAFGAKVGYRH